MSAHRYTTGAAAYRLGISAATLRKLAREGWISFNTDDLGKMSFAPSDVDRLKIRLRHEKNKGRNRKK